MPDDDLFHRKTARIDAPPAAPLNALVRAWRSDGGLGSIPWFDPDDGGVSARVLILMESPAPSTVGPGGSGFCSLDNSDRSNRFISTMLTKHDIPRSDCVKWNIVPWALHGADDAPRSPRRSDLNSATPLLRDVLDLLPALDVVLALGSAALSGFTLAVTEEPTRLYRVLAAPHPSQRNTVSRELAVRRIDNAFGAITAHLHGN